MKRGAVVKCIKTFKDRSKFPFLKFPRLNSVYMVRDVIIHDNGAISYRLFDLYNDLVKTANGIIEPSFSSSNFDVIRMPMNADEVINKALNSVD